MSPSVQRLVRYGAVAAVCVIVLVGAILFFGRSNTEETKSTAAAPTAAPQQQTAPARQRAATRDPINSDDDKPMPSDAAMDRALRAVGEARRLADNGRFDEAKAKLDEADKAVPGLGETAEARRKIAELATPEGQFATQIARARVAIDSDDGAAAEKALAEAERLKPGAPEIAPLRQALQMAQQKDADRSRRVAELLQQMHEAIARRDFAAADGALNEALRVDVLDPRVDQARTELAHAHEADRKREAGK